MRKTPEAAVIGDILAPLANWAEFDVTTGQMQGPIVRNAMKANGYSKVNLVSDQLEKIAIYQRGAVH